MAMKLEKLDTRSLLIRQKERVKKVVLVRDYLVIEVVYNLRSSSQNRFSDLLSSSTITFANANTKYPGVKIIVHLALAFFSFQSSRKYSSASSGRFLCERTA